MVFAAFGDDIGVCTGSVSAPIRIESWRILGKRVTGEDLLKIENLGTEDVSQNFGPQSFLERK